MKFFISLPWKSGEIINLHSARQKVGTTLAGGTSEIHLYPFSYSMRTVLISLSPLPSPLVTSSSHPLHFASTLRHTKPVLSLLLFLRGSIQVYNQRPLVHLPCPNSIVLSRAKEAISSNTSFPSFNSSHARSVCPCLFFPFFRRPTRLLACGHLS